jgi:hypothetical protein
LFVACLLKTPSVFVFVFVFVFGFWFFPRLLVPCFESPDL